MRGQVPSPACKYRSCSSRAIEAIKDAVWLPARARSRVTVKSTTRKVRREKRQMHRVVSQLPHAHTFLSLGDALGHAHFHHALIKIRVGKVGQLGTVLVQQVLKDACRFLQSQARSHNHGNLEKGEQYKKERSKNHDNLP